MRQTGLRVSFAHPPQGRVAGARCTNITVLGGIEMSKLIAAIAAVVATLYAATAAAQSAEPEVATIIVTAEKRAQDAQTVPIAVAAISGETLERSGISNSRDL
jgi:outer membrane receptor protein involved in Fe transport